MNINFKELIQTLRFLYVQAPVLKLGDREGRTGYIDFIEPSEMTAPIMKGIDCRGRKFVSFLLVHINKAGVERTYVETLFERSAGGSVASGGGRHLIERGRATETDLDYIERVVEGKDVGYRCYRGTRDRVPEFGRNVKEVEGEDYWIYEVGHLHIAKEA